MADEQWRCPRCGKRQDISQRRIVEKIVTCGHNGAGRRLMHVSICSGCITHKTVCKLCGDLTHRVIGEFCRKCGLKAGPDKSDRSELLTSSPIAACENY